MKYPIYLDHNATTPLSPDVLSAMMPYLTGRFGNPSCNHVYGFEAKEAVEIARTQVSQLLGCNPTEVVFTSGGTESNNLALLGSTAAFKKRTTIVISEVEHPAINAPCHYLEKQGYRIVRVPVDEYGIINTKILDSVMDDTVALITVMHANNETGSIQPIARVSESAKKIGALFHTDAAQSAGKIETIVTSLGVDLLTIAGHKIYAPKGVGALYVRAGTQLHPVHLGAGHENGLRPGTENVAGIVGLGQACKAAHDSLESHKRESTELRDELWNRLVDRIPNIRLNGHPIHRLPNTLNISFPDIRANKLLDSAKQIAASTGAACHEGGTETPSAVLMAMGIVPERALGAVRLSVGRSTTQEDIEKASKALINAYCTLVP